MVDFLLHFYRKGSRPFQSLSALPEEKAVRIMEQLFIEGSVLWERFRDPANYLSFRKQVEKKLRDDFLRKGGRAIEDYPVYLVLGRPKWTQVSADPKTTASTDEIIVPLSILSAEQVSFTYPDSMVSAMIAAERNPEYYEPDYHGKVFTLEEIRRIIERKGLPGEGWQTKMPKRYAHYIEAQVWNRQVLVDYYNRRS
jgi:hypothetical protein